MTISAVSATTLREAPPPRRRRLLEDERWLAFVLLVPTIVLLGMFIAYPFIRGILLSVTNSRVGMPGDFVGLANFYKIFNDGIFRTSVYNTFVYTGVTAVFKLALRSSQASASIGPGIGPLNSKSSANMDLASSRSPLWTVCMSACTVSLLFIMFSFTTYQTNSN